MDAMSVHPCRVIAATLVAAAACVGTAEASVGPLATARPTACKARTVAISISGRKTCIAVSKLTDPGTDLNDMLIRSSAQPALWRRGAYPSVYKKLGPKQKGLLNFDRALYAASRAVGKPLVPGVPVQPSRTRRGAQRPLGPRDETLGLNVQGTFFGWVIAKAERAQGAGEAPSGVQTHEAVTTGGLKPPSASTGDYTVQVKEEFKGDPCPSSGGLVEGKATYVVVRAATGWVGLIHDVENVVTVSASFTAVVNKGARLDHYQLIVHIDGEGGWSGASRSKPTLKLGGVLQPKDTGSVTISAPTGLDAPTQLSLAKVIYNAIAQAKQKMDAWLSDAQEIWDAKKACKKVTGPGGTLRPGETRVLDVTIKSIRGATANEDVVLTGRNGLEVVSPTGKITATGGKVKVTVRAKSQRFLSTRGAAPAYALDIVGVSELGRGAGTLTFKSPGYKFSGLKWRFEDWETSLIQNGYEENEVLSAQNCTGDPRGLWTLRIHMDRRNQLFPETDFVGDVSYDIVFVGEVRLKPVHGPTWQHFESTATLDFSEGIPVQARLTASYPDYDHYVPLVATAAVVEDPSCAANS